MNGNVQPGMEVSFQPLNIDSEYKDTAVSFISGSIFKLDELVSQINIALAKGFPQLANQLRHQGQLPGDWEAWTVRGEKCELLNSKSRGWRKGKMRIRFVLEFCPDEPDVLETPGNNQLGIDTPDLTLEEIRRSLRS